MQKTRLYFLSFTVLFLIHTNTNGNMPSVKNSALNPERLEWFQDLKFGVFISFGIWHAGGPFSSPWSLCTDNMREGRTPDWDWDVDKYRSAYWNQNKVFYPYNFDAEEWAKIAKDAGARYFIFYTKHHDGFNMYDTQLSDYKISSPDCPYSDHPNPDYAERLFKACREEGLAVGPCHSISDWHSPFYWKPHSPAPDRYENYDTEKEPERWKGFVDYFHGQIEELMTSYGKIDILWLDGGWSIHYDRQFEQSMHSRKQDLEMDRMVEMARSHQPDLIVVERGGFKSGSKHENYKTPERKIPEKPLGEPWETWWSMGDSENSPQKLIHHLVDIVCKGGNLLLHAPVTPDGRIEPVSVDCLREMGKWLEVNGEAIYGTRGYSMTNFREGNVCYTKKENFVYALFLDETENNSGLLDKVTVQHVTPLPGSKIYMLGVKEPLAWKTGAEGIEITIPEQVKNAPPCKFAYSFRVQVLK
ncbi:alpha-L-fucosidase [Bacteroidota bacterium]